MACLKIAQNIQFARALVKAGQHVCLIEDVHLANGQAVDLVASLSANTQRDCRLPGTGVEHFPIRDGHKVGDLLADKLT